MVAIKANDVDRAVRTRRPEIGLLLFYGPDAGRVTERARAAAEAAVADPADPFQLVRLEGDRVAEEPGRLADEAATFALFGGTKAVWVRPTARNIAPSVSACLEMPSSGTLIVVEAGDLAKTAPLRLLCERSDRALALPCYADADRDLASLVADMVAESGFRIEPDARALLLDALGGDRLATRGEVGKLMLYAAGRPTITVEDVEAVVSDVSGANLDEAIDAAFGGDAEAADGVLLHLAQQGVPAASLLPLTLRHALSLVAARAAADEGESPEAALRSWRGLHFRRRDAVARQIGRWRLPALQRVLGFLQDATLESRRNPSLAAEIAGRALFRVAEAASRGRSGGGAA